MFVKVRRAFTVGAVLFLLGMFTLPSLYLRTQCAALNGLCGEVLSAQGRQDAPAAQAAYEALQARFDAMRRLGELFLDHRVLDDAARPLSLMGVYLQAGDAVSLTAAASEFELALGCLLSIEGGNPGLFL